MLLLQDPRAKEVHRAFVKELKVLNKAIAQRNADPASAARSVRRGGLPYTAMLTDSPPHVTGRGVPVSPSI